MQAVNLYILTRNREDEYYTQYENVLSERGSVQPVKKREFDSLISLVDCLCMTDLTMDCYDGFYYSYEISHIGKELDLLKICKNALVLNIELKSEAVALEKMEYQLLRNKYYLEHLAPVIYSFTYVQSSNTLYKLVNDKLYNSDINELITVMKMFDSYETGNINNLFRARDFLISPLNSPQKFLEQKYFLTSHQEKIKKDIIGSITQNGNTLFWGINGKAGTGKTLVLYDLVKVCSIDKKCCVIHSGVLCEGHNYLKEHMKNVDIYSAKEIKEDFNLINQYEYIFVDEAQRIWENICDSIVQRCYMHNIPCVFSYDYEQAMSKTEQCANIPAKLRALQRFEERNLSERIRINKEIAQFVHSLLHLNEAGKMRQLYNSIDILYARNVSEAQAIIKYYQYCKEYTFISYTCSLYVSNSINYYTGDFDTHHVIGQEFDNVIIMMDDNFRYGEDGTLEARPHPYDNYLFPKLFYQAVTRAREKLCIVVVDNFELFKNINSIKYAYIEKEKI